MGALRKSYSQLSVAQPIPAGWGTSAYWAKKEGLSPFTAIHMLTPLVRAGQWERRKHRILNEEGEVRSVFIYREKPGRK